MNYTQDNSFSEELPWVGFEPMTLCILHVCGGQDPHLYQVSLSPSVQGQMRRIAQLCFPLVPIVLSHVSRLNSGQPPYISPMLGAAAAMHRVQEDKSEVCHTDSLPPSLPGSESILCNTDKLS